MTAGFPGTKPRKRQRLCVLCRWPVRDGAAFCGACGAPIEAPAEAEPVAAVTPDGDRQCSSCGHPMRANAAFCGSCGAAGAAPGNGGSDRAAAPSSAFVSDGAAGPAVLVGGAVGGAGRLAAISGAVALPWQTIATGEAPDLRMLTAVGMPVAQRALRASLKQPAIALLATTALDVLVASVSGQGMTVMVVIRTILGLAAGVAGLAAGRQAGGMRQLAGGLGLVTALVQALSLVLTMANGADAGSSAVVLLPTLVAQASSLVAAAKTAFVSLKR